MGCEGLPLGDKRGWHRAHLKAKEILYLAREDDHGDTARESRDHGTRNELDRRSQLGHTHDNEDDTSHERRDCESVDAVFLDDTIDDHDERASGPTNLDARSTKYRDNEARDDRGPQTAIRRNTARNSECYSKR